MAGEYRWLPLSTVLKYLPEMRRLSVSEVARSPRGFLSAYRRFGGLWGMMPESWHKKRAGFIARHLAQYRKKPTYRRWLALAAWAYRPDRRFG